jgi:hypothetical protein|tara:strand:- start:1710 stop:1856 length:147 start_codon:yes stop_codon:yes gene_type:complete
MSLFQKCLAVHIAATTPRTALNKTGTFIVSTACMAAFFALLIFAYVAT